MTLAQLCYLLVFSPWESPVVQGLDVLNETATFTCMQLMFTLTDMTRKDTHETIGWFFIVLVAFLITMHLLFLVRDSI
jgi:hypothetical protein